MHEVAISTNPISESFKEVGTSTMEVTRSSKNANSKLDIGLQRNNFFTNQEFHQN